jgi:hypothetical protein
MGLCVVLEKQRGFVKSIDLMMVFVGESEYEGKFALDRLCYIHFHDSLVVRYSLLA